MGQSGTGILVAYASKLGSTAEVAEFIGSVLTEQGAEADVRPLSEIDELDAYASVIIGAAIRYDRWLPDATLFVKENRATLGNMRVSFFFTCLTLATPTPAAIRKADGYADKLRSLAPEVKPLAVGGFAGVLQFSRAPWPVRFALKVLSIATGVTEGDYRDWEAIRSWSLRQF